MKEKELRRSMAVFTIGTVMKLTDLTARQIRYYEEQNLIQPERNEGNRRMFSLNDVDALLEIKDYISEGINMAGIKRLYEFKKVGAPNNDGKENNHTALTDDDVRRILHSEFLSISGFNSNITTHFIDPDRSY